MNMPEEFFADLTLVNVYVALPVFTRIAGLPLGGRTPYITSKNRLRTPKLHIEDVPRTSENSLVRPKMDIKTSCLQKKTRPHLPDYVIYVPPSYWKLICDSSREKGRVGCHIVKYTFSAF